MPKLTRKPRASAPEPTPDRVLNVQKVADREERKLLLSAIMRDPAATGAEVTAAGRLLEGMERTDSGADSRGIPPPTNRPEQVARTVRILTAAGREVTLEALDIIARRYENGRKVAFENRASGRNPMGLPELRAYTRRVKGDKYEEEQDGREHSDSERPEHGGAGAPSSGAGVPDVSEPSLPPEPVAVPDGEDGE